jgi:FKBP-type peptidyl-prolyl cis-trans isomerase FklB
MPLLFHLSLGTIMSTAFESAEQRASYGIGRQIGDQLTENSFEGISVDAVCAGIRDALQDAPLAISAEDINKAFETVQRKVAQQKAEQSKQLSAEGTQFLADNAKRAGVTTLPSGLQYEVLTAGTGPKPTRNTTVRTHYHGTLINGEVFDSSYQRGEPAEFAVGGVIAGWTEALQLMGVGSKWRLFIPSNLAYGERGAGGSIGPNATLVFDVELLAIVA